MSDVFVCMCLCVRVCAFVHAFKIPILCCLKDNFFRMSQTNSQNVVEWTSFFHARLLTISGYGKSYQLYKCNYSDILPSTTRSSKILIFDDIIVVGSLSV